MVNIAIIGSTGSIGKQTLNIVSKNRDKYNVSMLVSCQNSGLLLKQYVEFSPSFLGIYDKKEYSKLACLVPKSKIVVGEDVLTFASNLPEVDIIVIAVSGMIGLYSLESAIKNNKKIALANKESIVSGGELINSLLKKSKATIIPIDSEHSAVMQCLAGQRKEDLKRIILTASGGPFYGKSTKELQNVTYDEALKHPTWKMGGKISIDSATMMNKALEIIEARYLFDESKIDYIVHPESIVHSMVEYVDGAILAQLSTPSMEIPISYALNLKTRKETGIDFLDLLKAKKLTFLEPDENVFPAPILSKYAVEKGNNFPCRLNAANETAVKLFEKGKIGFLDIYRIVEKIVISTKIKALTSISDVFDCHKEAVGEAKTLI